MITRNDLRTSSVVIPQSLKDCLLRVGGTNIYDEPMLRLCLAEDRVTKANGIWNIWPATATLNDRSGLGINEAQEILAEGQRHIDNLQRRGFPDSYIKKVSEIITEQINLLFSEKAQKHPIKVVTGTYEDVPVYPFEGFILEKWKPAHCFGTPEQWSGITFQGEPALGPYPQFGDYDIIAGPTPYMPTESQLEEAVRHHFRKMDDKAGSPAQRVKNLLDKMEQRRKKRVRDLKNKIEAFAKDGPGALHDRVSLGAGRVRQELAEKAGLKGHYGN